jgi:PAS domain S-box-containing protein
MRWKVHYDQNAKASRIIGVAWDITARRNTELALVKERKLLSTLMEHLPDNIYFKDLDSRFISVNRAMTRWAGFNDPIDMIGKCDQDLFTSEHAQRALWDEREIIRTGKPLINREEKETWPDREDTWVSTTKMPLPFLKATVAISRLYFKGRILRCTDALSQKAGSKTRMSAKEIKNEIQMLEPAEKVEIFRWLSKQLHLADLVQGVGGYRASWNPLRVDQKGKSIP